MTIRVVTRTARMYGCLVNEFADMRSWAADYPIETAVFSIGFWHATVTGFADAYRYAGYPLVGFTAVNTATGERFHTESTRQAQEFIRDRKAWLDSAENTGRIPVSWEVYPAQ